METQFSRDLELMARKLGLNLRDVSHQPLEGLWQDIKITDREIEEAKAVFRGNPLR